MTKNMRRAKIRKSDRDKRRQDVYDLYEEIEKAMAMRKYDEYGTPAYLKMVQTGKIEFFDYDRGFLGVEIFVCGNEKDRYCARIWFATIDDGDYGGWSREMGKEEASQLVTRIAKEVFEPMRSLPSLDEMNRMLVKYGVHVGYE